MVDITDAALLDRLTPAVRNAFVRSIQDLQNDVQFERFVTYLRRGDLEGAVRLLSIGPEYFAPLSEALRQAFVTSGTALAAEVTSMRFRDGAGLIVKVRFDAMNPRAIDFLAQQSARLISGELTPAIRRSVRTVLSEGLAAGRSPRTVALDLVGRRAAGAAGRTGGLVGLTDQFRRYSDNAYLELVSGDPALLKNYLKRVTRNRSYDNLVRAAIRDKKPLPVDQARKMIASMRDRLLKVRGEHIARTELLESLGAAQQEGIQQMLDSDKLVAEQVTSTWDSAEDNDTRPSHAEMDGQRVAFGQPHTTGDGYRMRFPGDRSLGAPAKEIISCRCVRRLSIDHLHNLRQRALQ